ncbi:MAG: transposase [Pseudolabrys sp.]
MTLGLAPKQADLLRTTAAYCDERVAPESIYGILHRECFRLFPDGMFADLFTDVGRRSVPPMIVAVVMVLQRIEGCSDREAVDRFTFDARWKYAAGGLSFDYPVFAHTVLVDMRARLARSDEPDRIFQVTLEAAKQAGLVGRKRVLDSTPLYDAVATMDTVTLVRSAIRSLIKVADGDLAAELRAVLAREDDYAAAGKPACDYDDEAARVELVDALARDAHAVLSVLDGGDLSRSVNRAAALLASVVGQDLDTDETGVFRIAQRVAKDRVVSTVDPEARHGRKSSAKGFDGYKGHVAIDPDSELITATAVTAGNIGDAAAATDLLTADLPSATQTPTQDVAEDAAEDTAIADASTADGDDPLAVYGDSAYGTGELLEKLQAAGAESRCKVQPPTAAGGRFTKDDFAIDLIKREVICPAGQTAPLQRAKPGSMAYFGAACASCPLAAQCTNAKGGRTVYVGPYEEQLARARARQHDPDWKADYRATRPKVERKIGHLTRRRHGGRRARVRSQTKIAADFALLAAAVNLARLAVLGLHTHPARRAVKPTG